MDPERLRQIKELYRAAVERPVDQRASVLAQADPEIRREVEALLAQLDGGTVFSHTAANLLAETTVTQMAVGAVWGSYRIESQIGAGGMGVVYRALDTKLNRPVAIKFLSDELADAAARRRFQREAQTASSLNHPHIVTVYDVGEHEGRQYIVTEYIDGGTLKDWAKAGKHTWREVADLLTGVADGLATAHEAKILHRDVKPANVLITKSGYAKLADFGLAKLVEAPGVDETESLTESVTTPGMVIGTVAYMSPEQASGQPLDSRGDVFSFGVVLYELLAGSRPFRGTTSIEVLQQIVHATPRPLPSDVPVEFRRLVEKALAKNPSERYQSMREVASELKRLGREATAQLQPPPQAKAFKWASAAVGLLAVTGLAWWGYRATVPAQQTRIRSIAVLPLRNLSVDPDQAYLSGGLTEALTNSLGQLGALDVISRTSVMGYQGTQKTARQIASELHVDALVEGSVQRSAGNVLINVELVDGATDRQLWAKSYQRTTTDVLALQNEMSQAIVTEIGVKLTSQERQRLRAPRAIRPDAQEAYLRGLYWQDKGDPKRFYEFMQEAIRKDPNYALAHAGLADAYGVMIYSGMIPANEAYPKWRETIATALRLDESLPEVHRANGALLHYFEYRWHEAEREYRRAIQLNPNMVDAHLWLADLLVALGRTDEAVSEARRALQLNPNSMLVNSRLAQDLFFAKRYDEAENVGQELLEFSPAFAHWIFGLVQQQKGQPERAIAEYEQAAKLAGANPDLKTWVPADLACAYASAGRKAEARRVLSELTELSRLIRVDPGAFATIYTALGDKDRAFEWLAKGLDDRPSTVMRITVDPRFEPLRSDPRYRDFVSKAGLGN